MLLATAVPAWGGQARQLCLSCHSMHYAERGGCRDCHLGNPASERKNIAHAGLRPGRYARFILGDVAEVREGGRLMERLACRRCHVSGGKGNRLATSLDGAAFRKQAEELARSLRHPVAAMPDFALDDARVTALVNAVQANARGREPKGGAPVRLHFSAARGKDVFSARCGACHRLLSARGALGSGDIGPNLSGLLSPFYPETFRNGEAWSTGNLAVWLKNPRRVSPFARMRPVTLTAAETGELEALFAAPQE